MLVALENREITPNPPPEWQRNGNGSEPAYTTGRRRYFEATHFSSRLLTNACASASDMGSRGAGRLGHGLASVEGQLLRRTLGDRVGPGQHASGVVDVHVLNQAAVDRVNASQVLGYLGCSSRRDGIRTDDDPRLPTTRLYRRQITAFDPSA